MSILISQFNTIIKVLRGVPCLLLGGIQHFLLLICFGKNLHKVALLKWDSSLLQGLNITPIPKLGNKCAYQAQGKKKVYLFTDSRSSQGRVNILHWYLIRLGFFRIFLKAEDISTTSCDALHFSFLRLGHLIIFTFC